jgi:hypothetical protein
MRVNMPEPSKERLADIVAAHFGETEETRKAALAAAEPLIEAFLARRGEGDVATDQLLNAIRMAMSGADLGEGGFLRKALLRPLSVA